MNERIINRMLIAMLVVVVLTFISTIICVFKTGTTNNYNIEKVDTLVIPAKDDYKVYDKPFSTKTSDVEVIKGYGCYPVNFANMGYATPEFKVINVPIENWVVSAEYQAILYETCKKYNINYIQSLAIMYMERAYNNPLAENVNKNGTKDIGLMQFNTMNVDILEKITQSTDTEWLKIPAVNIECACYLMSRTKKYNKEVESLFDSLVVYNGGTKSLLKIKSGEYGLDCQAGKYAGKVISIMDELYRCYMNYEV